MGWAVLGRHSTPSGAVADLIGIGIELVTQGENAHTLGQLSLEDRKWLFSLLDQGSEPERSGRKRLWP
jgi:hypothetical protein